MSVKKGNQIEFFSFVQYAVNPDSVLSLKQNYYCWRNLFQFSCEQAILGVVFEGVKRLSEQGVKPPFDVLIEWIAMSEQIEGKNRFLNKACVEVIDEYRKAGYECCILKGQGNATMYPNPYSRMPGDIDLWVKAADRRWNTDDLRRNVTQFVRERHPENMEVRYYHVGYQDNGIEVEVHFMPNIMNNPWYNKRLQKWYNKMVGEGLKEEVELPEGRGEIPVPTVEFNIVFQLAHMMHHFFDEGIGLRQMMDYYFVLKARNKELQNQGNLDIRNTLQHLGLWKFAGAVMFVMQEVFALETQCMISPVDERRGKTLLAEILKGGNFGKYSGLTKYSVGGKYFAKTWRNLKLVREYPTEALCEPIFRTWHFFWRLFRKQTIYG